MDIEISSETQTLRDKALKGLCKSKALMEQREKQGWRFVKISPTTEIQVPCDENGNPTKKGEEKIQRMREHLSSPIAF